MKKALREFVPAMLLLLAASPVHAASTPEEPWQFLWSQCWDLSTPEFQARIDQFKALASAGARWDQSVENELAALARVGTKSCEAWGGANGSEVLQRFQEELAGVSRNAIALREQSVTALSPRFAAWDSVESQRLSGGHEMFRRFPCGKAFSVVEHRLAERANILEAKVKEFGARCVKSANLQGPAASAPARTHGVGEAAKIGTGPQRAASSGITGQIRNETLP